MMAGMFSFYSSYHDVMNDLNDEQRLELFDAMRYYVFDGVAPVFDDLLLKTLWKALEPTIAKSKQRSEAGSKGAKSKIEKQSGKQPEKRLESTAESKSDFACKQQGKQNESCQTSSQTSNRNGKDRSREELEGIDIEPNKVLYQSPLLDGWEKTGTRCRCRNYMYRHPSVEGLHCLKCEPLLFEEAAHV